MSLRDHVWLIILAVVVMAALLIGAAFPSEGVGCEEYGTVMVIVDGDKRCVPWEQAPDLQDFPQP